MNFEDNNSNIVNNGSETEFEMKDNQNLDVNKQNSDYYEKLMTEAGTSKDDYYDKNNPVVKIILIVLAAIIVLGSLIVLLLGL